MVVGYICVERKTRFILTLIKVHQTKSPVAVKAPEDLKWFAYRRI